MARRVFETAVCMLMFTPPVRFERRRPVHATAPALGAHDRGSEEGLVQTRQSPLNLSLRSGGSHEVTRFVCNEPYLPSSCRFPLSAALTISSVPVVHGADSITGARVCMFAVVPCHWG